MQKGFFLNKNYFFRSITFRLTIIVALILLLFGSIGIMIAITSVKMQLTKVIQKQQLDFSKYISTHIDTEIKKGLDLFTDLAIDLSKEHFKTDIFSDPRWMGKRLIPPILKYGVMLISPDGKAFLGEYPILPERENLSFDQIEWFKRAKIADRAIFSKPFKNRITQEPSIVFASSIKNDQKEVIAVIAGLVGLNEPELFKQVYASQIGGGSGILVISPEDKLFVASNIQEMVLTSTPEPGINKLHDMAINGYRGVGVTVNSYGVQELSAIASVESTGWFVVTRLPVKEAYLPIKQLSNSLVTHLILSTCVLILIVIIVLVIMLSPLKKAALSVRQMGSDKMPLSKLPIAYNDEVGDLIEGFNDLVGRIDQRTANLESTQRELESKIKKIKQLSGLLPICAKCKKIRDDKGYWHQIEAYIDSHTDASFSHGICSECSDTLYGSEDWYVKMKKEKK